MRSILDVPLSDKLERIVRIDASSKKLALTKYFDAHWIYADYQAFNCQDRLRRD